EEEVVFPLGEGVARVETNRAGGDGRRPMQDGRFEAFLVGDGGDGGSVVVHAVGDEGPAVVSSAADEVEFVAAAWAVFGFPEIAGFRVGGEALGVAMSVAPDGREGARGVDERVVGGDATVG